MSMQLTALLCLRANLGSLADPGTAFPDIFTASGKAPRPLSSVLLPDVLPHIIIVGMAVFILFATQSVS